MGELSCLDQKLSLSNLAFSGRIGLKFLGFFWGGGMTADYDD